MQDFEHHAWPSLSPAKKRGGDGTLFRFRRGWVAVAVLFAHVHNSNRFAFAFLVAYFRNHTNRYAFAFLLAIALLIAGTFRIALPVLRALILAHIDTMSRFDTRARGVLPQRC